MDKTVIALIGGAVVILVGIVLIAGKSSAPTFTGSDNDIVSEIGIHWHPNLTITINGAKQEIPSNIGLGGASVMGMEPLHTHDVSGQIHAEFPTGPIRAGQLKLGAFFEQWGTTFTKDQILDATTTDGGTLTMTVNGEPNTDYENYSMQDGDTIEITYQ
ncbi:hypothetical protein HY523_02770 [Candidatus Berkelbacteria bacterium]|nr:hypothetical protein [Candidatus Berkelbacteria bacterium]